MILFTLSGPRMGHKVEKIGIAGTTGTRQFFAAMELEIRQKIAIAIKIVGAFEYCNRKVNLIANICNF